MPDMVQFDSAARFVPAAFYLTPVQAITFS